MAERCLISCAVTGLLACGAGAMTTAAPPTPPAPPRPAPIPGGAIDSGDLVESAAPRAQRAK